MTREEKAKELAQTIQGDGLTQLRAFEALLEMAQFTDEHPKSPWVSVKDNMSL